MTQEKKQEFTRRLTQSNRTGVILIMYEIIFTHLEDAKKCLLEEDVEGFKASVRKAQEMIKELSLALDFKYELSKNLYCLYTHCIKELSLSMSLAKGEKLEDVESILNKLYKSFEEVSKTDDSGPMMKNAQTVYTGMTYGKDIMAQNYMEVDCRRGYFAQSWKQHKLRKNNPLINSLLTLKKIKKYKGLREIADPFFLPVLAEIYKKKKLFKSLL